MPKISELNAASAAAHDDVLAIVQSGITKKTTIGSLQEPTAFLDVEAQFGGGWSGFAAAVAEAEASGGPSAVVQLGKGVYDATSTVQLNKPITVQGGGIRGTRIRHSGTFDAEVIRIENLKRSGEWESTVSSAPIATYTEDNDEAGPTLRDFAIVDDDRSRPNRQGIYVLDMDDALFDSLQFGFLTGTALKLGADDADANLAGLANGRVRESDFRRIRIYRCGSGSPNGTPDVPAFILQNGYASGDGTNQNYFEQFRFVYNEGRMLMRGPGFDGNSLRRTIFRDVQLHALADNSNWSPSKWFPFDMVTLQGAVRETVFDTVMINGTKAGTACWAMVANTSGNLTQEPKRLTLKNINIVNTAGEVVRVEKGDSVHLEGTGLGGASEGIITVQAGSGFSRGSVNEVGINSPGATDGTVAAGTVYGYWHGQLVQTWT